AGAGDDVVQGQQGNDTIYGRDGDDDLIGGSNVAGAQDASNAIDGGNGNDVIAVNNATIWRRFDTLSPRFINLNASTIYNTFGDVNSSETTPLAQPWALPADQSDPRGVMHRDITLLDVSSATDPSRYGNDVIAGGAGDD